MVIIGGRRYCGKSTQAIYQAAFYDLQIVCGDHNRARFVEVKARELGVKIKPPITVHELREQGRKFDSKVVVDDMEYVLSQALNAEVVFGTTSNRMVELESFKRM